jgi:hypothetical protein
MYLDPGFSYGTNDLQIANRLFNLRRRFGTNELVKPKLDAVFNALVANDLSRANRQLNELEGNQIVRETQLH